MARLFVISELYYPEDTSTGYFVTGVAEGVAEKLGHSWEILVLCSQPTYRLRGQISPQSETRNGVKIFRIPAPTFDKNRLVGRIWNFFSLTARMGIAAFSRIERGDVVLMVTNPPSLPLVCGWACRIRGAQSVLWVQDVYPDVLVPTGLAREDGLVYRLIDFIQRHVMRQMERIVVLGRDMEARIKRKMVRVEDPIETITNWGEVERIHPCMRDNHSLRKELGLEGKFIVQMSGNLGRTHGLEDLLRVATLLGEKSNIHFLVFGWGAGRVWLEAEIQRLGLLNVSLLPPCEKEKLGLFLTTCDVFFLPFKPGMEGISVPSRLYNVMAAGNAILAVASSESELARVVEEEGIGWVKAPGDVSGMADVIVDACDNAEGVSAMRLRARAAVERKYTREHTVGRFVALMRAITGGEKVLPRSRK